MTTKDEALKMAIKFMETLTIDVGIKTWNEKHRKEAIKACKEALEQPKEWQGLSDDEMQSFIEVWGIGKMAIQDLEASFKEKNT